MAHRQTYGNQIFGPYRNQAPYFASISNLFHPTTIDACFAHDGHGKCGGIKDENRNWNLSGHNDRIVWIGAKELRILAKAYESSEEWDSAKLVGLHNNEMLNVSLRFSVFNSHLSDYDCHIDNCFHETGAVDDGIIRRYTCYPDIDAYQMIYNGPQFYVGNPFYKTPRKICRKKDEFDIIALIPAPDDIKQRTVFRSVGQPKGIRSIRV